LNIKAKLEKYFYIPYYSFKQGYVYLTNNILGMISSVIFISIVYYMWVAIYSSSGNLNYLELNETITYVVIITIINQIISRNTEMELGNKVISGKIAVDLIKPIGFFSYMFFNRIGVIILNFVFSIIPLILTSIFIFKINMITDILKLLLFLLSIILSFFIVYLFEFLIGLTSFFTTQIFGMSLLKSSLVNICAGLTIPLGFYPDILQKILLNLPFQAMYYIPVSIYLDLPYKLNMIQNFLLNIGLHNKTLNVIIEQAFWIVLIAMITFICWNTAKKKLVIQGG